MLTIDTLREQFPVAREHIDLNHAAVSFVQFHTGFRADLALRFSPHAYNTAE